MSNRHIKKIFGLHPPPFFSPSVLSYSGKMVQSHDSGGSEMLKKKRGRGRQLYFTHRKLFYIDTQARVNQKEFFKKRAVSDMMACVRLSLHFISSKKNELI